MTEQTFEPAAAGQNKRSVPQRPLHARAHTTGNVVGHDPASRTVTVQLVDFGVDTPVQELDGTRFVERFAPDSLVMADRVHVSNRHFETTVGKADTATYAVRDGVPVVDLIVSQSTAGRDVLADIAAGVVDSVSIEFESINPRRVGGVVEHVRAIVHGIAFAFRPQHTAPILSVREQKEATTVPTDIDNTAVTESVDVPDTTGTGISARAVSDFVTPDNLAAALNEHRAETERLIAVRGDVPVAEAAGAELMRYRSFGEYAKGINAGDVSVRALADMITDNNPGVIPEGWVKSVAGAVDFGAPTITAFGRQGLPDSGMDINYPTVMGVDVSTLVGQQVTQKTEVTSVEVNVERATFPILSFAGAGDLAYQLIERSDPDYLNVYLERMAVGYAWATNALAISRVVAAGTGVDTPWNPAGGDLAGLTASLVDASIDVETATGRPAEFALAATDVFRAIAKLDGVWPTENNTSNALGTGSARTLRPVVSGVPIIHDRTAAAGVLAVSNSAAATWHGSGPRVISEEEVARLGRNVAVWGMGNMAIPVPAGVVVIAAAARAGAKSAK